MTAQKLLNFNRKEKLKQLTIDCTNILLDPKIFMQFIKKNAAPKSFFIIYYENADAPENIQHYQALVNEAHQLKTSWAPTEEAPMIRL
uniref:Uncharacterized protein n=1 Tax=Panagrolaimus davidi TaxID=227884 RepID=A0A914QI17_9BILA